MVTELSPDSVGPFLADDEWYREQANEFADRFDMRSPSRRSFRVDWQDFDAFDERLADKALKRPVKANKIVSGVLAGQYDNISSGQVMVRWRGLPEKRTFRVGGLRERHLRQLVALRAEVAGTKNVEPWLSEGAFECMRCGTYTYIPQRFGKIQGPTVCQGCEENLSKGLVRLDDSASSFEDFQCIVVKPIESTLDDPPAMPVYLLGDLVNTVGKEDRLTVTGIYRTMSYDQQKSSRLETFIKASDIDVEEYAESDAMEAGELDDHIDAAVAVVVEESNTWGAPIEEVVVRVTDATGIREKEIRDRIADRSDDSEDEEFKTNGQLIIPPGEF